MAVLSIGLLALIGMFGAGYRGLQNGDRRTVAAQLAQEKMEALSFAPPVAVDTEETTPEGMTRHWSIQASAGNPGLWVITVEVSWKDLSGQNRSVFLKRFRAS